MKALSQEERAPLRKHGLRFGQYNLFLHPLLKPAPTRLRLILWSIYNQFPESPTAPPAGLVAIQPVPDVPEGYYEMAGYKLCGQRALRVDILERLADMIRKEDVAKSFEATQDMLSMTGSTHDSFAELMEALQFTAEKKERPKAPKTKVKDALETQTEATTEPPVEDTASESTPVETETYYLFTRQFKPKITKTKPVPKDTEKKFKNHKKKPPAHKLQKPRAEKLPDPDSPFAILQQLKSQG
jgi:ATP-dependent RNA helicase SUPV3L1/SUV3